MPFLVEEKFLKCVVWESNQGPFDYPQHFVLLFGSNWQERALTGDENSLRVGLRVDDIRDIPPCPPSTEVDWFSVILGEMTGVGIEPGTFW